MPELNPYQSPEAKSDERQKQYSWRWPSVWEWMAMLVIATILVWILLAEPEVYTSK